MLSIGVTKIVVAAELVSDMIFTMKKSDLGQLCCGKNRCSCDNDGCSRN